VIILPAMSPENAARRLVALGAGGLTGVPVRPLNADVQVLVNAWLAFMGPDIAVFWPPALSRSLRAMWISC